MMSLKAVVPLVSAFCAIGRLVDCRHMKLPKVSVVAFLICRERDDTVDG